MTITLYNNGTRPLGFGVVDASPVCLNLGKNEDVPAEAFVLACKAHKSSLLRAFHDGALRMDSDEHPSQVLQPQKARVDTDEGDERPAIKDLYTKNRPCIELEQFLIERGVLAPAKKAPAKRKARAKKRGAKKAPAKA